MKRFICLPVVLLMSHCCFAQLNDGRIETYAAMGFFAASLTKDSLVPPKEKGKSRLGDMSCFGLQYDVPIGSRISVKAGIGFSTRHFSLSKYNVGDFITAFFLFDSQFPNDTFPVSRIKYENHYVDVPLAFEINKGSRKAAVQIKYGATARLQFLIKSTAAVTFSTNTSATTAADKTAVQKAYTKEMNRVVFTLAPYMDISVRIYKKLGAGYSLSPVSVYASSLNSQIAKRQTEFLTGAVTVWYQL